MEDHFNAETDLPNELDLKLKAERKKLLTIIGVLIVINTILFPILIVTPKDIAGNFSQALKANLFGFSIIGFILAIFFTLIPYKGLPYKRKYLRTSLIIILIIQALEALCLLLLLVAALLGWN